MCQRTVVVFLLGMSIPLLVVRSLHAAEAKLVQIEMKDKDGAGILMKATELERGDKTSKLKIIRKKRVGSVGGSMFVVQACYEIAKARQCEYFANLKEWDDEDGGRLYIIGFTNNKDADIKKEFGEQFDYKTEFGQQRKVLSVSQFRPLFEQMSSRGKKATAPPSPEPGSRPSK
jgi:hypothetical protein